MAFGMKSLPASLCLTHKPLYLGLYHSPSIKLPAFHSNVGAPMHPSIQCNAKEESDTLVQEEKHHHKEVIPNPSWSNPNTPAPAPAPSPSEPNAGWPPVDPDPHGSWKVGLLQVGAGFVLAFGFSIAAFTAYSRYGAKKQVDLAPFTAQQQQASIAAESESIDASSNKGIIHESPEEESKQDLQKEGEMLESEVEAALELEIEPDPGQVLDSNKEFPVLSSDGNTGVLSEDASDDVYTEKNPSEANIKVDAQEIEKGAEKMSAVIESIVTPPEKEQLASQSPLPSPSFETGAVSRVNVPASTEQQYRNLEGNLISGQVADFKNDSDISSSTVGSKANDSQAVVKELVQLEEVNPGSGTVTAGDWHQVLNETATSSKREVDLSSIQEDLQHDVNEEANSGVDSPADESKYDTKGESIEDDQTFSGTELPQSAPVYITAPLSAAAAAQSRPGKVVVPAVVDQMQQHALEALQALKVMDPEILAGDICTRREYARWLIASSSRLTRSAAHKVFPAMYIENVTQHAFDDISAEDPDFPFIQGLAEAGLIWSNLSKTGVENSNDMHTGVFFEPDSALSRQDLVSWKVALDRREITGVDKEVLQKASGFVDVDQIHKDAWPALMADLTGEDPSIIALAFGFTRRFQPEKPTTKGQAAIALASGEAAENVSEELARLEAEAMAEEAVAADIAMEVRAQRDINGQFNEELELEKAKREQAEKLIEEVRAELQKAKAERDEERYAVMKDRATLDSEKELLTVLRQQVDEQLQAFSGLRVEVAAEKERLEKLRVEREEELKAISNYKLELEVERRALTLVRSWAEDEAKQAQAQGQVLEETRKRWENLGLEVDNTTHEKDDNLEQTKDIRTELENLFQQVAEEPGQQEDAVGKDFKSQVNDLIIRSWQATTGVFSGLFHKVASFLEELVMKLQQLQQNVTSSAGERAQNAQEAVGKKNTQDVQAAVGERVQNLQAAVSEKAQNVQASVAAMSTSMLEGSKRFADNCKGEAEKLAHRFKHE